MVKFRNVSELKGLEAFNNFAICSDGRLMNLNKQSFLKGNNTGQYLKYTMSTVKDGVKHTKTIEAYKLVALAFVEGWFEGAEVDHIKQISQGGCDDYTNLRWVTHSENMKNRIKSEHKKRFVIAHDLKTNEKHLFDSIGKCCKALKISTASAYKCLAGFRITTGGYKLYFVEQ